MLGLFSSRIFMGRAQRQLIARGAVFTYHKISEAPRGSRDPFLYVSPRRFDEQLGALRQAGYQSASLDEVAEAKRDLKSKVVLTFDDGFLNAFENGLKFLGAHSFRAIQFLVAGALGGQNDWDIIKGDRPEPLMNQMQIREWLAAGHEIGSHSVTHRNLKKLTEAEAREEIFDSKQRLENQFGIEVRHFCYPFGGYNQRILDLVQEAGYQTASTVLFGVNEPGASVFELRRIIPLSSLEMIRKVRHRALARLQSKRVARLQS
jgi:peptidoglycan/xylan/chitin deacetylase (PgdA/CDA1 family)